MGSKMHSIWDPKLIPKWTWEPSAPDDGWAFPIWASGRASTADFTEGNPPSGGGRTRKSAENAPDRAFIVLAPEPMLPKQGLKIFILGNSLGIPQNNF